jgi:integrase
MNKSNPNGFVLPRPAKRTKKKALTKDQVAQILEFNAIPGTSFYHTKNYFVFSYLSGGMDFQDLALLSWQNVFGDRFEYTRARTGKTYSIRINKEMKRIMDYYWNIQARYVFPILNNGNGNGDTGEQVKRIRAARKQFNENMTEIARSLGINIPITSSMIRHTFASVLYSEGAPLPEISMALKHNNVLETKAYLEDIDEQVRDRLQDMLL